VEKRLSSGVEFATKGTQMMKIFGGVFCLIFAASSGHLSREAQAQATTANQQDTDQVELGSQLFRSCQASIRDMDSTTPHEDDLRDGGFCLGYFRGFGDYNAMAGSSICLDRAHTGTAIRVYVAYMEKNPKYLDDAMIIGVIYALKEAYPCPAPKNQ
jgi:hypothetical protein